MVGRRVLRPSCRLDVITGSCDGFLLFGFCDPLLEVSSAQTTKVRGCEHIGKHVSGHQFALAIGTAKRKLPPDRRNRVKITPESWSQLVRTFLVRPSHPLSGENARKKLQKVVTDSTAKVAGPAQHARFNQHFIGNGVTPRLSFPSPHVNGYAATISTTGGTAPFFLLVDEVYAVYTYSRPPWTW